VERGALILLTFFLNSKQMFTSPRYRGIFRQVSFFFFHFKVGGGGGRNKWL